MGTIKIRTGLDALQFLLHFFKPAISIDGGQELRYPWGESTHEVAPGNHTVNVVIPYVFGWRACKASGTVSVAAGETVTLSYRPAVWAMWRPGRLQILPS
jgi:hypothetical protein